jgi:hypothetical protein
MTDETIATGLGDTDTTGAETAGEGVAQPPPLAEEAASPAVSAPEEGADASEDETPEAAKAREVEERKAARIREADEAEKRAQTERERRRKERAEQERIASLEARERQIEDAFGRVQEHLRELGDLKQKILSGGPDALKALGVDYPTLTRKYLEDNSPEALAQRAYEEAQAIRREIQEREEAARRADEERRRRMSVEAGRKRFSETIDTRADEYPHAFALPERFRHAIADEIAEEYIAQFRRAPTIDHVLELLDERAKSLQEESKTRSEKRARPPTTPSDGTPSPQDTSGNGLHASKPPVRTLTSAAAATKATARRPMTDEEIDEWARQELRQAMQADRARST